MMESLVPEYDRLGVVREREGAKLSGIVPTNTYLCQDGQARDHRRQRRLDLQAPDARGRPRRHGGRPALRDERRPRAPRSEVDGAISAWTATLTAAEVVAAWRRPRSRSGCCTALATSWPTRTTRRAGCSRRWTWAAARSSSRPWCRKILHKTPSRSRRSIRVGSPSRSRAPRGCGPHRGAGALGAGPASSRGFGTMAGSLSGRRPRPPSRTSARRVVRVGQDVASAVQQPDRDLGRLHARDHLGRGQGRRPGRDRAVHLGFRGARGRRSSRSAGRPPCRRGRPRASGAL